MYVCVQVCEGEGVCVVLCVSVYTALVRVCVCVMCLSVYTVLSGVSKYMYVKEGVRVQ